MNKYIYMDNAASTRADDRVVKEMESYFLETYAVATSEFAYSMGIEAKEALDNARHVLASSVKASDEEIIFTSGSAESSNLALKGIAKANKGNHLVISAIEDFPVLHSAKALEKEGFEVTYLGVDAEGFIDVEQLEEVIREDTILVSIQHANQEIGTIQDIHAIGDICKDKGVLFHTDATQSYTRIPLDVSRVPVDLVTVSGHTIHGPKGIGGLYIRDGTPIVKIMDGGFQEYNKRGGLENIPGAAGFAKAVGLVTPKENNHLMEMRDRLINHILTKIPDTVLNGPKDKRLPHNANITFHHVEGESITLHLDMKGIAVSTGSACFSRSLEGSHVIVGIGGNHERAHGSVRFTLGRYNTMEEVEKVVEAVAEVVEKLREISPLGKGDTT
jgi:cysteine desulfurase